MGIAKPCKVLIIDDNVIDREIYKRCLWEPDWHCEFAEADNATAGLEMAATWRPDCALVDVNLPDMDGIEALERLRTGLGRIPFAAVVLTAYSEEAVAVRAITAGAMDYLPKRKVSTDTLPRVVRHAVERFLLRERIEQQRRALDAGMQRYQVLLETIPLMVWAADAEGRVEYANRRWSDYTGLSPANAAHLDWNQLVHPADRERTWDAWRKAIASAAGFEIEHRLRRAADGAYRWHLVRAIPMQATSPDNLSWLGTCTEIESQKQSGEASLQRQKLESLGRLAGGLAHDLNNLLVVVLGNATFAMEALKPSDPARQTLGNVMQAGQRAADLIRKMLGYAGKGTLRPARTQVDKSVRDAVELAGVPKSIKLELHTRRPVPPVETDAELLRQAIADLLRNSVEAIGEQVSGTIVVRTALVELHQEALPTDFAPAGITPGKYVAVEVQDTGCGMDEETMKKAFDPFFTTKFLGRGLGLSAVHGFARSSGGSVQVKSAPGKGARFRLLLPPAGDISRDAPA